MDKKIKIVVIGGGFGGLYTAKKLAARIKCSPEIILIDKRNYFLFTPLLHEVASSTISEKVPVESLVALLNKRDIIWKVGTVKEVNLNSKKVVTDLFVETFDYLVVATGTGQNTYGIQGVIEHTYPMKDLEQAILIKDKLINNFEVANVTNDSSLKSKLLSIVIVGAGATGIELAGEIADFASEACNKYYSNINRADVTLTLVNPTDKLLPRNNPKLSEWVSEYLLELGWCFKFGSISKVIQEKVLFEDESSLEGGLIIWTAGVKPNMLKFDKDLQLDNSGRILVQDTLQFIGYENVFGLGDVVNTKSGLPMLAQVAVQQADLVAKNIVKLIDKKTKLSKFMFNNKGFLLSVGKWNAVGEVYGYPMKGKLVWILWHFVYFLKFISWNKKLKVAFDWLLNLFSYRDISKE